MSWARSYMELELADKWCIYASKSYWLGFALGIVAGMLAGLLIASCALSI